MARTGSTILDTNNPFPQISLSLASGQSLELPVDTGDGYAVVLFYRGFW